MFPKPGPPRTTSTTTTGSSVQEIYDKPSCIRLTPGLELEVIVRLPVQAAPYTILMAPSSLSACTKARLSSGMRADKYSSNSV